MAEACIVAEAVAHAGKGIVVVVVVVVVVAVVAVIVVFCLQ